MQYLTNTAASVREAGIVKAYEIAQKFGKDWALDSFVPEVIKSFSAEQQGYNYRVTAIRSLAAVIEILPADKVSEKIVPIFVKACQDPVPNV